jgi:uncharacterized protein YbjT (DUF2867 family)
MKQKILIAGATGFTGKHVVNIFLQNKDRFEISVFARDPEKVQSLFPSAELFIKSGCFEEPESLINALRGQDVFLNIASLGFGHADAIVSACLSCKVKRTVFLSSTSIYTHLNPASKAMRLAAEKRIRTSGLEYTIVRPTMIFGAPGDRNIEKLIRYVKRWPILVVPGPGTYLMQPVYVKDLAKALHAIVESANTIHREYTVSGGKSMAYNLLVKTVAESLKKHIMLIHLSLPVMVFIFRIYGKFVHKPLITVEQIYRLNEDKAFPHDEASHDFGYAPIAFSEAIKIEIKLLGLEKPR